VQPAVTERSRARVDAIRSLGIRVIGDPERLLPPAGDPGDPEVRIPEAVSVEAAAAAVVGALEALFRDRQSRRRAHSRRTPPPADAGPALSDVDGRSLARELGRRARRRLPGSR
jgi:hypothetical protein